MYVICLYSILVVIKSLLQCIRNDPPDILDHRNIVDIYLDLFVTIRRSLSVVTGNLSTSSRRSRGLYVVGYYI
jgi:hypothetical protein